jgi:hypothetical protein
MNEQVILQSKIYHFKLLGGGTLVVSLFPIWILKKRWLLKFGRRPQFQNTQ